jgi:glycosyltransferase involved in cell wall biosynthesis
MLRVMQVHNRYRDLGGEDTVVANEASMLRAAGHEVLLRQVTNSDGGATTVAKVLTAPWNPASARAVGRAAADSAPDLAHVHNTWFTLSPSVLAALHGAGVPVVVTLHNYRLACVNALLFRDGAPCEDCVGTHPWAGVRHRCYRGSTLASAAAATTLAVNRLRRTWLVDVDRFIAPTLGLRDVMVASGLPAERVVVRPHAVADPGPRQCSPSSSAMVLFVGRISHEKGIDVLLDAWSTAAPPSVELVVIGDGPGRPELERRRLHGVHFTGWLSADEVRARMLSARALAFPSLCYEVLPATIVEAMAAGLPVLASDHGGPAELVGDLGRDWLARPGDRQAWAEALARLPDDAAVDAAGAHARRLYEQRYTEKLGLQTLLAIYEEAMDHRRRSLGEARNP